MGKLKKKKEVNTNLRFILGTGCNAEGKPEKVVCLECNPALCTVDLIFVDQSDDTLLESLPLYSKKQNIISSETLLGSYTGLIKGSLTKKFLNDSLMLVSVKSAIYGTDKNKAPIISLLGVFGDASFKSSFFAGSLTIQQDSKGYWTATELHFMPIKGIGYIEFASYGKRGAIWDKGSLVDTQGRTVQFFKGFADTLDSYAVCIKFRKDSLLKTCICEVSCSDFESKVLSRKRYKA